MRWPKKRQVVTRSLLTAEEEARLIAAAQSGDTTAEDALVQRNVGLVYRVARRYGKASQDDMVQEGFLGLLHGIRKFDLSRNVRLSTYCYHWIRQRISRAAARDELIPRSCNAIERGVPPVQVLSLDISTVEDEGHNLASLMASADDVEGETTAKMWAEHALTLLEQRERTVVVMCIMERHTLGEVACVIGCSREGVRGIRNRALKKLRERVG